MTTFQSIQCFPVGRTYNYTGDYPNYTIKFNDEIRPCTPEEAREILITERAERYIDREILCCDSCLVEDLIKASTENEILEGAFSIENINFYQDPSDWTLEQLKNYAGENGLDLDTDDLPSVEEIEAKIKEIIHDSEDRGEFAFGFGGKDNWSVEFESTKYFDETYVDVDMGTPLEMAQELRDLMIEELDVDEEELRDKVRDHLQENPSEVYQWFRVSEWLAGELESIGEVVIDNDYGCWWGRGCCGQAVIMDGTMQRIAEKHL